MGKKNSENSLNLVKMTGDFVKRNWSMIILAFATFIVSAGIVYFDANTNETIASFALEEYEIGQVADRTIYATKSLPADDYFPVSVEEGEKVIRKGFPITEEEYYKLRKMAKSPVYVDYRAFCNSLLFLLLVSALWIILFNPVLLKKKVQMKESVLECILFVSVLAITAFGDKLTFFQTPYSLSVLIPGAFCGFLVAILFGQT